MPLANEDILQTIGGKKLALWHRGNGKDLDAAGYLGRYRGVLLSGLSRTKLFYLDTNYWVRLRDAELGYGTPEAVRFLQTLRAMVRAREILCVSHFHSFLEIGKQEEASLRVTARLLDELTEGVVIASPADLLAWECAEFIGAKLDLPLQHELCAWAKVGQIHKHELPSDMPGPVTKADRNVILKSVIDTQWNTTFEHIFGQFEWETKSRLNASLEPEVLAQVEARKQKQAAIGLSREQTRLNEFSQAVDGELRPIFASQLRNWHVQHEFPEGVGGLLRHLQVVLDAAVKNFKTGTLGRFLPSVSIRTKLYTLYEMDRKKGPFTNNDWVDWNHAAAALPYCDMFFTEKHLAHLLCKELRADQQFGCEVIGTMEEAVRALMR